MISRAVGTPSRVAHRVERSAEINNIFSAIKRRRKITPRQRDDIKQRRDEGEDPKDLALEFSITASYVRQL